MDSISNIISKAPDRKLSFVRKPMMMPIEGFRYEDDDDDDPRMAQTLSTIFRDSG